jgi:hypothetical protein
MPLSMTETHYQVVKGFSKDAGAYWTPIQKYATSANASSTALEITNAPTTGTVAVIDDMLVSTDTDLTLTIRTTTATTTISKIYISARLPMQLTFRNGLRSVDTNNKIEILSSASGNIAVTCSYHCE